MSDFKTITESEIVQNWGMNACLVYLAEILNGEYSLEEAREDILSLRDSKYDNRIVSNQEQAREVQGE